MTLTPSSSHGVAPGPAGGPGAPYQPDDGDTVDIANDSGGDAVLAYNDDDERLEVDTDLRVTGSVSALGALQGPSLIAGTIPQVSPAGVITSGALTTQQFVSGTAATVDTTTDREVHTPVTFNSLIATVATCTVALSPDNVTYSTLCVWTEPVGVALAGTILDVTCRVPAGWFLKLTVSQAVLGLSTWY